jgi:hypothetical protein
VAASPARAAASADDNPVSMIVRASRIRISVFASRIRPVLIAAVRASRDAE